MTEDTGLTHESQVLIFEAAQIAIEEGLERVEPRHLLAAFNGLFPLHSDQDLRKASMGSQVKDAYLGWNEPFIWERVEAEVERLIALCKQAADFMPSDWREEMMKALEANELADTLRLWHRLFDDMARCCENSMGEVMTLRGALEVAEHLIHHGDDPQEAIAIAIRRAGMDGEKDS